VRRFVAQSNVAVYGRTGPAVQTEEDAFDPSPAPTMRANQEAILHLEEAILGARWTEGIADRDDQDAATRPPQRVGPASQSRNPERTSLRRGARGCPVKRG
jgi:hypothetical protein